MENYPLNSLIDLLSVSGYSEHEIINIILQQGGHQIFPAYNPGFIWGDITQVSPDRFGRLILKNRNLKPLLFCGHTVSSPDSIGGICFVCKKLICTQCLLRCDLTLELVCPRHSTIKRGIVIGDHAKKKWFWRLKARRIRKQKELELDATRQISYK